MHIFQNADRRVSSNWLLRLDGLCRLCAEGGPPRFLADEAELERLSGKLELPALRDAVEFLEQVRLGG